MFTGDQLSTLIVGRLPVHVYLQFARRGPSDCPLCLLSELTAHLATWCHSQLSVTASSAVIR
jgi:hypothetical protein